MLDEMGIAALAVALVERARVNPHPQRNLTRRHAIVAHGIAQAIGQFAEGPFLVLRHVAAAIEPWAGICRGDNDRNRLRPGIGGRTAEQQSEWQQGCKAGG